VDSCKWRPGWNSSPEQVRIILCNAESACKNCKHHTDIRAVATQFLAGLPKWWVVNGRVVVPIWIVEQLKMNLERRRKPRDPSDVFSRPDSGVVPRSTVA
jgi:hypothetical protein